MRILAAIGVLALLPWTLLHAQAGKKFSLSGTVIDGASKRPLAGVELTLQTQHWGPAGDSIFTDSQGRFDFTGLAAGEYILTASGAGFGTVHFGEASDPGWVSTIQVGAKGADKTILFSIAPRASIEGLIRDEFGDPMMRTTVSVLRSVWHDGRSSMANAAQQGTDDRGYYRFSNLAPGSYMVCAGVNGGTPPVVGPVDFAARVENRAYVRTCNSGSLQLAAGQHVQVDLTPMVGSTANVSGRIRNLPPQTNFSAYLQTDQGTFGNTSSDPGQGTFTIRGVAPGHYRLHVNTFSNNGQVTPGRSNVEMALEVGGSDITGVEVSLDSGSALEVAFHGEADSSKASITLRSADPSRVTIGSAPSKEGILRWEGIYPGRYWLQTRTSDDVCVVSVKLGDREMRGQPIDLASGATVRAEVTLSTHCGAIRLRTVREGQPVPYTKAVLLLSGTPKDPGDMLEDFTNDEGELSFTGLAPGRYLLWAWAVQGAGAMAGPANLAAVSPQATVVDVTEGAPVAIDVPLLHEEAK